MIEFWHLFFTSLAATLAMTAFSYGFSYMVKGNYKEPQLLNYLLAKIPSTKKSFFKSGDIIGWLIHFITGFLFVVLFAIISFHYSIKPTAGVGLIYGFIIGLIGVIIWSILFKLHPSPPKTNRVLFFTQLIIAHIIFGLVMALILNNF